jgi:hypothetical protein
LQYRIDTLFDIPEWMIGSNALLHIEHMKQSRLLVRAATHAIPSEFRIE